MGGGVYGKGYMGVIYTGELAGENCSTIFDFE